MNSEVESMQNGSIMRSERRRGPDVWEFRWREPGANGKSKHRRMVVGPVDRFRDKDSVMRATTDLRRDINMANVRGKGKPITLSQLTDHYCQRELAPNNRWKTHSTKLGYRGYLRKWIIPRWGGYTLTRIRAGEIELWLRSLPLARSTCAKIRNVMSVLFNHGLRHELLDRNPVQWVRQSAKRKKIPAVLEIEEVKSLLGALEIRERTMVLLDVVTGLRASELFGLKWTDINFKKNEISVTRSIVLQVVGPCKTEASQKPVPLDPLLARTLRTWRAHTTYKAAGDWVFASPYSGGRKPYWYQSLMRNRIREVARRLGITKKIGWHTFRHTCATLLRASGADIKVVQELLRHASCRVTLDTYTQAVTEQKRAAQNRVASLVRGLKPNWALRPHRDRISAKIRRRFDRNLKQSTVPRAW
jgi:integrase